MVYDGIDIINNGFWYIPKQNITKKDCISYKELEEFPYLHYGINDENKFDDYLASLITEVGYIQSVSKLFRDIKDESTLEEKLKRIDNIDKIHNEIVFLKKLFFKGIYHLEQLKEFINSGEQLKEYERYYHLDDLIRIYDYLIKDVVFFEYFNKFSIFLDEIFEIDFFIDFFNDEDDFFIQSHLRNRFGHWSQLEINCLINVWVAIFCLRLKIKKISINTKEIFGNDILIENINALDKELGLKQIHCFLYYSNLDDNTYYEIISSNSTIFSFISHLSKNKKLDKEYFSQNSRRCYSEMWIDGCKTQYYSLSGAPNAKKVLKYYKIAEEILNANQSYVKYESILCTDETRYYYSNQIKDFVTYFDVKSNQNSFNLAIMFSCCERKLLTIVEKYRNQGYLDHKTVHMCIKYSPCQICDRGLNAFENNGVKFKIICLENYTKKNKFSEIDKKIKDMLEKKLIIKH